MGASASVDLRPEEVRELEDMTAFEPKEIKSLYKRFRRLDRGGRGTISTDDLNMIPEISMNPIAPRLNILFDKNQDERINFKSFVKGLSHFSVHARPEVRCQVVFRLYDVDSDGYITEGDLVKVLQMMVGSSMTPEQIAEVAKRSIADMDIDKDGKVDQTDFEKFAEYRRNRMGSSDRPVQIVLKVGSGAWFGHDAELHQADALITSHMSRHAAICI